MPRTEPILSDLYKKLSRVGQNGEEHSKPTQPQKEKKRKGKKEKLKNRE